VAERLRDVDALVALLLRGREFADQEAVDLLAHGLQCAAGLAQAAPDDAELQVAGLVHDIGSIVEPGRAATHAATGAAMVAPLLGRRVAALVAGHDQAKRYLVTTDPAYAAVLSPQSVATLAVQGGVMTARDRAAFERRSQFADLLTLRRADDRAKDPTATVTDLGKWRVPLETVARSFRRRGRRDC